MTTITDRLMAQSRINPVSQPNRVQKVTKQEDGSLRVTLHSGKEFGINKDDKTFQEFLIYSVLARL